MFSRSLVCILSQPVASSHLMTPNSSPNKPNLISSGSLKRRFGSVFKCNGIFKSKTSSLSRKLSVVVKAEEKQEFSKLTRMRSEAQAPFRTARTFLFGGLGIAGALGTLFALPRVIGSVLSAPNAAPLLETVKDLGIDVSVLLLCFLVIKRDRDSAEKQMARISREETLSMLQVELASGRIVQLEKLRNFARPVIVAGSAEDVQKHIEAAEPYKVALLERGVVIMPLVLDNGALKEEVKEEKEEKDNAKARWRATPVYTDKWRSWLNTQMKSVNVGEGMTVYLSLRMDGRVRGSGKGCPQWDALAVQLPPTKGMWSGLGDGFDGIVGEQ